MMQDITLNFGVTGDERKRLVKAVSAYKQVPSEYLGVPSFAFRVDEIIIDRDGVLVIEGGMEQLDEFLEYLRGKGFHADGDHTMSQSEETAIEYMVEEVEDLPEEFVTEDETAALEHMAEVVEDPPEEFVTEDETAALEHTMEEVEDPPGATVIMEVDAPTSEDTEKDGDDKAAADGLDDTGTQSAVVESDARDVSGEGVELTIQIPREGFTDQSLCNLQKIIESKASLLKKSLGTDDLSVIITDDTISFPWFQANDPVSTSAYMHLVTAICDMAKKAKRVTVTNQDIESEKYAFRTWLIRLGFGGPEYKEERAVLLKNLSGTSAFKNREAAEAFNERMKAKRVAARLTDN